MYTTTSHIDKIIEKLALIKSALELHGKNGTLSLHKNSELIMMHVLTLAYNYQLEFLGKDSRFPGVDLGSQTDGIAIQVTSRNDNDKVNDAIEKFLKNNLQKTFPRMIVLMMNTRIAKYPLKPFIDPTFQFDTAKDIIDFNDLVQKIKTLMPIQIQLIAEYLEKEMPGAGLAIEDDKKYLINTEADKAKRKLDYYFHSAVTIEFTGAGLSAAKIYRWLNDYFNDPHKRFYYLTVLSEHFRNRTGGSGEVVFEIPLNDESAVNYAKHTILKISQDKIQIEFATYYSNREHNTNLQDELGPMLVILLALPALKLPAQAGIKISYDYRTNGKIMFYNMNAILSADTHMQIFYIDKHTSVQEDFKNIGDEELLELLQEIADTFVNEPLPHQSNQPFMAFDRNGQLLTLNHLRSRIQPALREINE
ncbi:SMEK domain-containing protein [Mucilaginibacter pedocola]|uniref:SMEK domain-containing protein n=1 Tax=Mucilaginibacter pedocola TaxID=1792845 RepID=A0A1S9PBC7_9SPHI|nr:SMEK domain-containing protein [Mucilaginibacter pedocola]OOQ58284.1 hypothetical protein BC343_11665 [Mucilaginibacter pedocola]